MNPILQEDWDAVRAKAEWFQNYFRSTDVGGELLINALAQVRADERARILAMMRSTFHNYPEVPRT